MRRLLPLLLPCFLVVAACGGGDDGAASDDLDIDIESVESFDVGAVPADPGGAGDAGGQPSGALVRIVNVYAPLDAPPDGVDVHASPFAGDGATPIVSVPYGTASEFFDPTVADDAGNMFLSFYAAGEVGSDTLITQTETLAGGEVITYILATGEAAQANGRRFGSLRPFFHGGNDFVPAPPAGTGSVFVDTLGIDQVIAAPDTTYYYVGVGDGCAPAVGDTESSRTLLAPGTSAEYNLPVGSYQASIFATEDCSGTPLVGDVPIEITDGGQAFLVVYAPADGDLRALFVPAP